MINDILNEADAKMAKSVDATREEFATIRAGRAHPSMFSKILVDYYGTPTPIQQLASFTAPEPRIILVQPFDMGAIANVEKAIRDSDLGLNPSNDGNVMRLSVPELTEERRRDLVKMARQIAEEGRVGIRNVRRDVMQDLRELKNEGDIGADEEKRAEGDLQKITDEYIANLDATLKTKEAEILEV